MTLKDARLGRAEDLLPEKRRQFNLPDTGLIIIQSVNPELREEIKTLERGMSEYLRSLGEFIEHPIAEE